METLYDLLGALPRDDADELRSAFRRAVKGAHPDINPGDPDAGVKFRQIVRANEILSDEEQRAAYDHLLVLADDEQKQMARHAVARVVYRLASAVLAVAMISIVSIGSFALFLHLSSKSIVASTNFQIAARAPAELASPTPPATPALSTLAGAEPPQPAAQDPATTQEPVSAQPPVKTLQATKTQAAKAQQDAAPARVEAAATVASEPIAPVTEPIAQSVVPVLSAAMVPPNAMAPANVVLPSADADSSPPPTPGPPLELAQNDAKAFREQGIVAYRNGDLKAALADFDQAITLDPNYAAAYIDRGIVLYRMRKFERAFADLAHAKKLDHANKTRVAGAAPSPTPPAPVPPPRRPRLGQGGLAFGMMFPRRPMGME